MPRIGIDLSATRCHLIAVRTANGWAAGRSVTAAHVSETQIAAFETIPYGWSDPAALVPALRRWLSTRTGDRSARVTIWGLAWAHRLMVLPAIKPAELAGLARRQAVGDVALLDQPDVITGITTGDSRTAAKGSASREVAFIAASAPDIRARIQLLMEAGFVIESVATPPLALCSLARLRRDIVPGTAVALLSIASGTIALAIVRDGLLLFAREIPWGYRTPGAPALDRDQFAAKLAAELRRSFLFFKQTNRTEIAQVLLCGDTPDLRSLTAPLIVELDLEIETLDSLDGIAADSLPPPADVFGEQVAAFRVAWAMAADAPPPINLVPSQMGVWRRARRLGVVLAGGATAAVVLGLFGYGYVDRTARSDELRVRELEQQIADVDPHARTAERMRQNVALADVRRAALDAFDSQGPRLARALQALGQSAPPEVTVNTLKLTSAGASWVANLSGTAVSSDPARAQASVNDFLRALRGSPYLALPAAPPLLRVISDATSSTDAVAASPSVRGSTNIPAGMTGIEFTVTFEIAK